MKRGSLWAATIAVAVLCFGFFGCEEETERYRLTVETSYACQWWGECGFVVGSSEPYKLESFAIAGNKTTIFEFKKNPHCCRCIAGPPHVKMTMIRITEYGGGFFGPKRQEETVVSTAERFLPREPISVCTK